MSEKPVKLSDDEIFDKLINGKNIPILGYVLTNRLFIPKKTKAPSKPKEI